MFASNSPDRRHLIWNETTFNNEGPTMTWRRPLVWLESSILYGQFLYWFYDTIIYSILKEVMWINSIFSPSSLIGYHRLPPKETLSVVKGRRDEFYVVGTPYLVMKGTKFVAGITAFSSQCEGSYLQIFQIFSIYVLLRWDWVLKAWYWRDDDDSSHWSTLFYMVSSKWCCGARIVFCIESSPVH